MPVKFLGVKGSDSFYSQILHCVQDDSPAGVILSGSEESLFMRPISSQRSKMSDYRVSINMLNLHSLSE